MLKKRMNKRGQGSETGFGILPMLLGIIALVIIGTFLLWVFGVFGRAPGATPGSVAVAATTCKSLVKQGVQFYCIPDKEIKEGMLSKVQYMNCKYIKDNYDTEYEDVTTECSADVEAKFCEQKKISAGDKFDENILVNGITCKVWLSCAVQTGEWKKPENGICPKIEGKTSVDLGITTKVGQPLCCKYT